MTFPDLQNAHAGQPAVVIGKGPSLDAWIGAGCPQPAGAVRIGVNQVAAMVPDVPYSVTGDCQMEHYLHLPTLWLRGVPYLRESGEEVTELPPGTGLWFDARPCEPERLTLDRESLAASRRLYCAVSSTNPAVHFAWYLGCTELLLVGIDGGPSRAVCVSHLADRPAGNYDTMKRIVESECDVLFGHVWNHWKP